MDWVAFRTANLALGNDADAAAIEISVGGIQVICEEVPIFVAFCGASFLWQRQRSELQTELPQAARLRLVPGDKLIARAGDWGSWTYLAVEGGLDTPIELGSRATHTRSAMGGIEGRMLRQGDSLPICEKTGVSSATLHEARIEAPWLAKNDSPIRIILGPQDDYFSAEGLAVLLGSEFILTNAADRMAYRFDGPEITHSCGFNIVSDGIALGAIQIAGDCKPLILMADRQPTGGYPKIAHVARADIGRLAQMRPGERCRFVAVSIAEARTALLALEDEVTTAPSHLRSLQPDLTSELLLGRNLVDGFVDAFESYASPRDEKR
jgi:biotin-dependent carboxylase-like uncharacterized protein